MSRSDVKAVLDYLMARLINTQQAKQQLAGLGLQVNDVLEKFLAGEMSYDDVFTHFGV